MIRLYRLFYVIMFFHLTANHQKDPPVETTGEVGAHLEGCKCFVGPEIHLIVKCFHFEGRDGQDNTSYASEVNVSIAFAFTEWKKNHI